jgi:adenosylcobinamide kinase / adenosylcobinamide-phosphate guanylyltransferase
VSLVLLLGGARSGKSQMAEAMATAESARLGAGVTYIPGSPPPRDDPDWAARIEAHRRRRPAHWETAETVDDLASFLGRPELAERVVLLDSLGTWLARRRDFDPGPELVRALAQRGAPTLVVSEEVGMGVHPSSEPGRRFRDALGLLDTAVAEVADEAYLVVAGRRLRLDRP